MAMSIDDDCGATAAALEVVLGEQIRCEQDDGALHSAACASGRGYEEVATGEKGLMLMGKRVWDAG